MWTEITQDKGLTQCLAHNSHQITSKGCRQALKPRLPQPDLRWPIVKRNWLDTTFRQKREASLGTHGGCPGEDPAPDRWLWGQEGLRLQATQHLSRWHSSLLPLFHYHSPFSSTTNLSFKHTWLNSTSLLGRARYEFLIVILSLVIPYYICLAQQAFDKYVQNNWKVEHLQRNLQNMYWNYNMSSFSDMSYRLEGCVLTEEEAGVRWLAQGQEGQPQVRHTPSHNHPRESRGSNIQVLTDTYARLLHERSRRHLHSPWAQTRKIRRTQKGYQGWLLLFPSLQFPMHSKFKKKKPHTHTELWSCMCV